MWVLREGILHLDSDSPRMVSVDTGSDGSDVEGIDGLGVEVDASAEEDVVDGVDTGVFAAFRAAPLCMNLRFRVPEDSDILDV